MSQSNLKKLIIGLLLAALLVPLVFYKYFYYPFITGKALFFRVVVLFLFLLFVYYFFKFKKITYKQSSLWWIYFGLTIAIFLSALFGVNFSKSFWSNMERAEGVLLYFHLFVYFALAVWLIKGVSKWRLIFKVIVSVSLVVMIFGLLEYFGATALSSGGGRIASLLGNASYLGSYLIANIFLALYLLAKEKNNIWKGMYGLVVVLGVVEIFMTQTRGAFAGLVFGLFIAGGLLAFQSGKKRIKYGAIGLVIILTLLMSSIFVFKDSPVVKKVDTVSRISRISLNDYTTMSRLRAWQASWRAFGEKPVFGWGLENFNVAFTKYFPPEIYVETESRLWFDRAHSVFFEYLTTTGVIGAVFYVLLIAYLLYYLYKGSPDKISKMESAWLIGLVAGLTLANLFVFDTINTLVIFVLILAFANNELSNQQEKEINLSGLGSVVLLIASLLFLVWNFNADVIAISSNRKIWEAELSRRQQKYDEAYDKYLVAVENNENLTRFENRRLFIIFAKDNADKFAQYETAEIYEQAIKYAQISIEEQPYEARHYFNLSQLYLQSSQFDENRLHLVIDEIGPKLKELAPTMAHTYYQIGEAHFKLKQYSSALDNFYKATRLNPFLPDPWVNVYITGLMTNDSNIEFEAEAKLKELRLDFFNREENLKRFIPVYRNVSRKEKVIESFNQLIELAPDNITYYTNMALYYNELGELDNAIETINRLKGRDEKLDIAADQFIDKLKSGELR